MLYEILRHIRNFFVVSAHMGNYEIENGLVSLPFLSYGQYYLIEGSIFNDGIHRYEIDELHDEVFDGNISALAIPEELISVVSEIEDWNKQFGNNAPYQSESFAGYSYTRATNNGKPITWKDAFASRLNAWRKI